MAICEISFSSRQLGMPSQMLVLTPPGKGPFATLYLLHGYGDDYTAWTGHTFLERYAARCPIMIVTAQIGKCYGVNTPGPLGVPWENYFVRDVVNFVDENFRTAADPASRGIAGNSMGGYASLMLALRHPDLFGACCSLSGAVYFTHAPHPKGEEFQDNLSAALPKGEYDCFALAEKLARPGVARPKVRLECGDKDFLLPCNRQLHEHMAQVGYEHEYLEYEGGHNWLLWESHLPAMLEYFRLNLRT
jgi:putative tributyrin esterase